MHEDRRGGAAQPRPYVDGPAWQALCDATSLWRLQSYVRPVDAGSKPAGHDVIRFPGFSSAPRARSAGQGSEYPGLRFAGSSSPHFALAKFDAVTGKSWVWIQLSSGRGSSLRAEEFAGHHDRPGDTGHLVGEGNSDEPRRAA